MNCGTAAIADLQPTTPPVCPYCQQPSVLVDSARVYHGVSYGKIWLCSPCEAWVGVHKGTDKPLGRLADARLRAAKIQAHAAFDRLWMGKMKRDKCPKQEARGAGYHWLAGQLGIPRADCHIGRFDVEMCQKVIRVCQAIPTAKGRAA